MNVAPGHSADAVRRLIGPGEHVDGLERQVSTDQANLSMAVDERYLVKWFRAPVDHSSLVVLEQLSACGFPHMPRFIGAIEVDGRVAATVTELIPGATDGWQWYVDDVLAWLDGSLALDALVATAARMGEISAALHSALVVSPPSTATLEALRGRVADRRRVAVEQTTGPAGERLRGRLGQIGAALTPLQSVDPVPVQRVHGDLHAGQFLRAGDRLLLTDFDGDPLTAAADRVDMQPVETDVAALLQSIDHVGRVAARRRPGADVDPFIVPAIEAAELVYRRHHALDERLLFALRVAQELHEFAYAATRLAVWGYVPDAAVCALFPDEDAAR